MLRLSVVAGLLIAAGWLAHQAGWFTRAIPLPLGGNPHTRYQRLLDSSGLLRTASGHAWLEASHLSLSAAKSHQLPSQHTLAFSAHAPAALGVRVALKRGQRLEVIADVTAGQGEAFVDVFASDADMTSALHHEEGALRAAAYEADAERDVIVRVQPELGRTGLAAIRLRAVPALRFPVSSARVRDLKSVFGDARDAGNRKHEGVDIFAARGTAVLSATDGVVLRVGENRLGGRVVWVWDASRNLRIYYAHLNEQLVSTGQLVRSGDIIGTVGNTGNARTTPPHLHFGIYERAKGAIDPFWFIAPVPATATRASR